MAAKKENTKGQEVNLPKNIQQMGRTEGGIKIYLEDYSGTYLRRILSEEIWGHGILLGKRQVTDNQTYFFVQAVLSVGIENKEPYWKYNWNEIYELMQKYFIEEGKDNMEVLGWAMPIEDYKTLDLNELEKMHKCNFEGNMTLAFTIDMQEGREQFYILENNRFHSLSGYYIYYEKNKAMHNYVLENQPGPCVETEEIVKGNSESYRTMLLRRKEQMQKQQTIPILYTASTFLVMLVIVLGITMMNNYEKMENMQAVLSDLSKSILNDGGQKQEVATVTADTIQESEPVNDNETVQAMSSTVVQEEMETYTATAGAGTVEVNEVQKVEQETIENVDDMDKEDESDDQNVRKRYEIQPGDTLAAISLHVYNTEAMVEKICEYNQIEDGDQIVAGDVLLLP